jgi:hypothetical protein
MIDANGEHIGGTCVVSHCSELTPITWFCPFHTKVKEAAYTESARLGENYYEVIVRRDRALREATRNAP